MVAATFGSGNFNFCATLIEVVLRSFKAMIFLTEVWCALAMLLKSVAGLHRINRAFGTSLAHVRAAGAGGGRRGSGTVAGRRNLKFLANLQFLQD